jgi:hypothetical protein
MWVWNAGCPDVSLKRRLSVIAPDVSLIRRMSGCQFEKPNFRPDVSLKRRMSVLSAGCPAGCQFETPDVSFKCRMSGRMSVWNAGCQNSTSATSLLLAYALGAYRISSGGSRTWIRITDPLPGNTDGSSPFLVLGAEEFRGVVTFTVRA